MNSREAFEKWINKSNVKNAPLNLSETEHYSNPFTLQLWRTWQAAQQQWHPISSAPKDKPILAIVKHSSASEYDDELSRLSIYGAHLEDCSRACDGLHIVEYGGEYQDSETYLPPWWFVVNSGVSIVANPILWMPLPEPPKECEK